MYEGRRASLATKHDKLPLVAPPMLREIGLEVCVAEIDTDSFGTFAGDIPRPADMLKTAVAKARAGMRKLGMPIGFASEGSIGRDGFMPISDLELVVFVDDEIGFHVSEAVTSYDIVAHSWTQNFADPREEDLKRAGFPDHGLIVRCQDVSAGVVFKGIHDPAKLKSAIEQLRSQGMDEVVVESDLRANHCPSRRSNIRVAAERLAIRLTRRCPSCDCPGWGEVRKVRGRVCASCHAPTYMVMGHVNGCAACGMQKEELHGLEPADPSNCPYCNP